MRKGKSKTRIARHDITRLTERSNAKRARRKPDYDHRRYDGFSGDEALSVEA